MHDEGSDEGESSSEDRCPPLGVGDCEVPSVGVEPPAPVCPAPVGTVGEVPVPEEEPDVELPPPPDPTAIKAVMLLYTPVSQRVCD